MRIFKKFYFVTLFEVIPFNSFSEADETRSYTLNCNGTVGDMVYLKDLDYSSYSGHSIAEVKIYGLGINYIN